MPNGLTQKGRHCGTFLHCSILFRHLENFTNATVRAILPCLLLVASSAVYLNLSLCRSTPIEKIHSKFSPVKPLRHLDRSSCYGIGLDETVHLQAACGLAIRKQLVKTTHPNLTNPDDTAPSFFARTNRKDMK